jgi:hypothetical protein
MYQRHPLYLIKPFVEGGLSKVAGWYCMPVPSRWYTSFGFFRDPFEYIDAEKIPHEAIEALIVVPHGFDMYVDSQVSTVITGKQGSGKTAQRRWLERILNKRAATSDPFVTPQAKPFVVVYNNFAEILATSPPYDGLNHLQPLLRTICSRFHRLVDQDTTLYVSLPSDIQTWFSDLLSTYLPPFQAITFRRKFNISSQYVDMSHHYQHISVALKEFMSFLEIFNYTEIFILVDGINGGIYEKIYDLAKSIIHFLLPIDCVIWKIFLPDLYKDVLDQVYSNVSTPHYRMAIETGRSDLVEFLSNIFMYAHPSVQQIDQLYDKTDPDLDIEQNLIDMALQNPDLGAHRSLLNLFRRLFYHAAATETPTHISSKAWDKFKQEMGVSQALDDKNVGQGRAKDLQNIIMGESDAEMEYLYKIMTEFINKKHIDENFNQLESEHLQNSINNDYEARIEHLYKLRSQLIKKKHFLEDKMAIYGGRVDFDIIHEYDRVKSRIEEIDLEIMQIKKKHGL